MTPEQIRDVLASVAAGMRASVEQAHERGLVALVDGIELTRMLEALARGESTFTPNPEAAQERLRAVQKLGSWWFVTPGTTWEPAPKEQP